MNLNTIDRFQTCLMHFDLKFIRRKLRAGYENKVLRFSTLLILASRNYGTLATYSNHLNDMALSCSLRELPLPRMFVISTDDFLDLSEMRFVCWREGDDLATHVVITCDVGSLSVCLLFGIQSKPAIPCLLLRAFSKISKLFQIYPYLCSNIHLSSMYQRSPSSMYTKNLSKSFFIQKDSKFFVFPDLSPF